MVWQEINAGLMVFMAEFVFFDLLFSGFDLLRLSVIFSIPAFVLVFLASRVRFWAAKRFHLSWIRSTAVVSFAFVLCLVVLVYFFPIALLVPSALQSDVPPEFAETPLAYLMLFVLAFIRLVLSAAVITLLLFPVIFVGSFLFDWLSSKTRFGFVIKLYLAVLACTVLSWYFLLFIAPFVLPGIIYLVFFGLQ